MANTISSQPITNTIVASYRTVIFHFRVDLAATVAALGATSANPASYCDIYINGAFYRTLTKTQPASTTATTATYEFDIQDALQEALGKHLGQNGGDDIEIATPLSAQVFCRFRRTYLDLEGFQKSDGTAPIQATGGTGATAGTGLQSNRIHAVNVTLQHEDSQELSTHLNAFKTGTWNAAVFPLTHRGHGVNITRNGSDHFPILINDAALEPECLKIYYRQKNQSNWSNATECQGPGCIAPVIPAFELPDAMEDIAYNFTAPIGAGTGPFTLSGITKPAWMTIAINGSDIEFTGTPATADIGTNIAVNFTVENACGASAQTKTIDVLDFTACTPVSWVTMGGLPDATIGSTYNYTMYLIGTAPYNLTAITKPAWMTITQVGPAVHFTGTPTTAGTFPVLVTANNCAGGESANLVEEIEITEYSGCFLYEFAVFGADDQQWTIQGTACGGGAISLTGYVGDGTPAPICGNDIIVGGNLVIINDTTHC